MRSLLLSVAFLLLGQSAHAARAVMEGIKATKETIFIDTGTARVHIGTGSYGGGIQNVGLFVGSNVVIGTISGANNVVIYATGSVMVLGSQINSSYSITYSTLSATQQLWLSTMTALNPSGIYISSPVVALYGVSAGSLTATSISASSASFNPSVGDEYGLLVSSQNAKKMLVVTNFGVVKSTTQPAMRFTQTSAISIPASANTAITFQNKEYESQEMFSVATATMPIGGDGYYFIRCMASWANGSTNKRRAIWVEKNGVLLTGCKSTQVVTVNDETAQSAICFPHLIANDAITCMCFQDETGATNINSAAFEVIRMW